MTENPQKKEARDASCRGKVDKSATEATKTTTSAPGDDYLMSGALQIDDSYINVAYALGPKASTRTTRGNIDAKCEPSGQKTKRP